MSHELMNVLETFSNKGNDLLRLDHAVREATLRADSGEANLKEVHRELEKVTMELEEIGKAIEKTTAEGVLLHHSVQKQKNGVTDLENVTAAAREKCEKHREAQQKDRDDLSRQLSAAAASHSERSAMLISTSGFREIQKGAGGVPVVEFGGLEVLDMKRHKQEELKKEVARLEGEKSQWEGNETSDGPAHKKVRFTCEAEELDKEIKAAEEKLEAKRAEIGGLVEQKAQVLEQLQELEACSDARGGSDDGL